MKRESGRERKEERKKERLQGGNPLISMTSMYNANNCIWTAINAMTYHFETRELVILVDIQ
jgi:exonuclease I